MVSTKTLVFPSDCIYNITVTYEWDETKAAANTAAGRLSFEAIDEFEWEIATVERSDRQGETRWAATGYIGNRLYRAVYTRRGKAVRIISLRIAGKRGVSEIAAT